MAFSYISHFEEDVVISVQGEKNAGRWQSLGLSPGLNDSKAQWLFALAVLLIHWGPLLVLVKFCFMAYIFFSLNCDYNVHVCD